MDYGDERKWGAGKMNEDAKRSDLVHSGLTQTQTHPTPLSTPISRSPDTDEYNHPVMISGGVLDGWHGRRIQSRGQARCLVQLEENASSFLVEIDENLVERASSLCETD